MPSKISKEAYDKKLITKKQYDKLPAHLLDKISQHKLALEKKLKKKK